jgi:hypothetical protein
MPKKEFPGSKTDDRRMRRARLIRDGASWRQACLQAGYSMSVANKGMKGYSQGGRNEMRTLRPGVIKDFERAAAEAVWKPETLRKIVIHRLATSVVDGKPSGVAREAELIGRLKETDMFVNPHTGTDIGIFALIADPHNDAFFEKGVASLKEFEENRCTWCDRKQENAEALRLHTLSCPQKPGDSP